MSLSDNQKQYKEPARILRQMKPEQRHRLFGEILELALNSEFHQKFTVTDFPTWYLPPIDLDQFRIYRKGKKPVGWVSWAWLTDETAAKYQTGGYTVRPNEWNAGKNLWFVDFITPFGDANHIIKDLTSNIFPDHHARSLRSTENGELRAVCDWYGDNLRKRTKP